MKNKFDKNFEDLGWADMQKLLDRDLPVAEKKRRRGLVFWLSLMVGLLAVTGTFMYAGFKNNQLELNTSINNNQLVINNSELNKPINNNQLVINNAELNTPINNNQLVINNSELNKPINNNQVVINNAELNKLINNNQSVINNSELNKPINNNQLVINNSELNKLTNNNQSLVNSLQISNNKQQAGNTPPQYLSEKQVINKESCPQGKVIPVEQVLALNTHKLKEIQSDSVANSDLKGINWTTKPKIIKPIFKPETHFGIATGVHTEGGKTMGGWQLGVVFNHQFKRNWSYSAGLNFRKTTVNSDSLVYYKVELSNSATPYTNSPSRAKKLTLNGLNYLELPLNLNYHLNKKWSIAAGIKTSYLLSANINISSDSTLFILQTGNNSIFNKNDNRYALYDANSTNQVNALGLKRLDLATMAGIQFNPTKRIQLSLRYDYGLSNILNRTNWSAYNRFIGFNAAYYFK